MRRHLREQNLMAILNRCPNRLDEDKIAAEEMRVAKESECPAAEDHQTTGDGGSLHS